MNIEKPNTSYSNNLIEFLSNDYLPIILENQLTLMGNSTRKNIAIHTISEVVTNTFQILNKDTSQNNYDQYGKNITPIVLGGSVGEVLEGLLDPIKYVQVKKAWQDFFIQKPLWKISTQNNSNNSNFQENPIWQTLEKLLSYDADLDLLVHHPDIILSDIFNDLVSHFSLNLEVNSDEYQPDRQTASSGYQNTPFTLTASCGPVSADNPITRLCLQLTDEVNLPVFHIDITQVPRTKVEGENNRRQDTGGVQAFCQRPLAKGNKGDIIIEPNRRKYDYQEEIGSPQTLKNKPNIAWTEVLIRELRKRISHISSKETKEVINQLTIQNLLSKEDIQRLQLVVRNPQELQEVIDAIRHTIHLELLVMFMYCPKLAVDVGQQTGLFVLAGQEFYNFFKQVSNYNPPLQK